MKGQLDLPDIGRSLSWSNRMQVSGFVLERHGNYSQPWLEPVNKFFEIILPVEKMYETIYTA